MAPPCHRKSSRAYLCLAQQHLTAGLSGFSAQLAQADPENCGGLYLGAVLTSYCTFAAGPTSPRDLLVATADGAHDPVGSRDGSSWMPFVSGVRTMNESFTPDMLFSGSMAPLNGGSPRRPVEEPAYTRDGFPRIEWEAALDGLRAFIAGDITVGEKQLAEVPSTRSEQSDAGSGKIDICVKALDELIKIYAATYGRRDFNGRITYHGPAEDQFIFAWLYRMDRAFASSVRKREPYAMLVVAYYAVILNTETISGAWYVEGWGRHIVEAVVDLLTEDEDKEWMRWPIEQILRR